MSETREQFRERVGRLHLAQTITPMQWEQLSEWMQARQMDMAEPVYAQALRDVLALTEANAGNSRTIDDLIDEYARERGIDLDGGAS